MAEPPDDTLSPPGAGPGALPFDGTRRAQPASCHGGRPESWSWSWSWSADSDRCHPHALFGIVSPGQMNR
jgi:hypothetical protein